MAEIPGTNIDSVLQEQRKFECPENFRKDAHIKSLEEYERIYKESVEQPEKFWAQIAEELHWFKKWDKVLEWKIPWAKWFVGGQLNLSYNCLDRHVQTWRKNKAAIIWESEPGEIRTLTYQQLHREVQKFANVLKGRGITKGDRVAIYMGMTPELPIALLACARIGAPHSVVFGGFSSNALVDRINDSQAVAVITQDGSYRRGAEVKLFPAVEEALKSCPSVKNVIVYKRTGSPINMQRDRDYWWHELMAKASDECPAEPLDAEHPLYILYTSGTTGKPKGLVHTTGGYSVGTYLTTKWVFDLKEEDTYWCTADIGWVTGHSYIVYGPLANGATTLMYEGVPSWPDASRIWQVVDRHQVEIVFTAPTALRALMKDGDDYVRKTSRASLKLLGTVGEPINPEAWRWYHDVVGEGRCPIIDTWWQTETGAAMIAPLPGATALKPGSATRPLFGVVPQLVDGEGKLLDGATEGNLCITQSWPGQMRTVWGDHARFFQTYFSTYPGRYFTGDGCRRDADGYYWITGRVDDVINVSGHRMGTAEVESALVLHAKVAEAAVVGFPHDIKGQGIYAYVTLNAGEATSEELRRELRDWVRTEIGPIATPDAIQFAPGLPKTRSGKIMRRILRKIAEGDVSSLGDTSTLADPAVVDDLVANRVKAAA